MKKVKEIITLTITNNTAYTQNVNILGNAYNARDTANAKTEYRWDITGFVFTTENTLNIAYKTITATLFTNYTTGVSDITSALIALNGLGIGTFTIYTALGLTYISTYNDNVVFDNLSIYNNSVPILNYYFSTPTVTGGNLVITVGVPVVTVANPANQNGSVPVTNGIGANITGNAVAAPNGFFCYVYDNGVLIFSSTLPLFYSFGFLVVSGHIYDIYCTDSPI